MKRKDAIILEDTFHYWHRSFHPPPVPADQTHFQKNILIRVPRQKELSRTKKQEKTFEMKIFIGKKTC